MNITVDLKRNPDIADLISNMQMGDGVCFCTSLKSKDDNLAEFTLDRAMETPDSMKEDESSEEDDSHAEAVEDGDEMESHAKMPSPNGSRNTPGGSSEQDKLAASLTAQL